MQQMAIFVFYTFLILQKIGFWHFMQNASLNSFYENPDFWTKKKKNIIKMSSAEFVLPSMLNINFKFYTAADVSRQHGKPQWENVLCDVHQAKTQLNMPIPHGLFRAFSVNS